jgi:hypothetical protein
MLWPSDTKDKNYTQVLNALGIYKNTHINFDSPRSVAPHIVIGKTATG